LKRFPTRWRAWLAEAAGLAVFVAMAGMAVSATAQPVASAPLQQSLDGLLRMGAVEPFGRPLTMESRGDSAQLGAVLEGLVERPFRDVRAALADLHQWCAVLILHINNKGCTVTAAPRPGLALKVGRRYDQPADQAFQIDFGYQVVKDSATELSVRLDAPNGPMGTSNYGIHLDAMPAGPARTAVRLTYSYRQTSVTGWAMDVYMSTVGRGKVGFSRVRQSGSEATEPVAGVRGLMERNLMRYFLAIDAAAATPVAAGPEAYVRRLNDWFASTERYPRQLHEIDLPTYLSYKRALDGVGIVPGSPASGRAP
jgi:hypothetical protein